MTVYKTGDFIEPTGDGEQRAINTKMIKDESGIKEELEVIKQAQADILGRLNDGVDTRVTGSSVEYVPTKDTELIDAVQRGGLVALDQNLITGVGAIRIWTGTLNEYDAIEVKDDNIIYMVRG